MFFQTFGYPTGLMDTVGSNAKSNDPFLKLLANVALVICLTGCGFMSKPYPSPSFGRVSFSPDGKYLVCGIEGGSRGSSGIYRMDKDWAHPIRLTTPQPPACDGYPAYSPNGLKIAFARHHSCNHLGTTNLFIMNSDGTNLTQLTSGSWVDTAPAFSPDGQLIYFRRSWDKSGGRLPDTQAIYSVGSDGSPTQRITADDYEFLEAPTISPDGKYLVFYGRKPGETAWYRPVQLRIMSLESKRIEIIKPNLSQYIPSGMKLEAMVIEDPFYSPDGKYILFAASIWLVKSSGDRMGAINAIYRFNMGTRVTEQIADVTAYGERWPSVSPGGETIVFLQNVHYTAEAFDSFWSVNSDGTDPHKIELHMEQATR